MKKTIFISAFALTLAVTACSEKKQVEESDSSTESMTEEAMEAEAEMSGEFDNNPDGYYGKIIQADGAKMIDEFAYMMEGKDSLKIKIQAVAADVCKNKGCWMKVETADGSMMRIKFKDYGFFVPMDITGKKVVFEGVAFRDTTSVEDLKHYAKDGGQSEEEIAAITKPEISTSFIADGVILLD